MEFVRLNCC